MMDEHHKAVEQMRIASEQFIARELSFEAFQAKMSPFLGGTFDPLDWEIADIDPSLQKEVLFYSRYLGGEFGEHDHLLPESHGGNIASEEEYRSVYAKHYTEIRKV